MGGLSLGRNIQEGSAMERKRYAEMNLKESDLSL